MPGAGEKMPTPGAADSHQRLEVEIVELPAQRAPLPVDPSPVGSVRVTPDSLCLTWYQALGHRLGYSVEQDRSLPQRAKEVTSEKKGREEGKLVTQRLEVRAFKAEEHVRRS